MSGFKQFGYKLSPIAAWPYVQARVKSNMSKAPYSYYFVDADAFGEYYDDYTPGRMATQKEDAEARVNRLKWITDTFHVPVGSEGGNDLFTNVLAVTEGVVEPPLPTWSDPDLTDKSSKYYLGRYYPPDGPDRFLKPAPMKMKVILVTYPSGARGGWYEAFPTTRSAGAVGPSRFGQRSSGPP